MSSLIGTRQDASLRNRRRKSTEIPRDLWIFCRQRIGIADLDVSRLDSWPFGARAQKPVPSPDYTRSVKSTAGNQKLHTLPATQVWTDYNAFGRAIDVQHQHVDRITERIMIKLVVADAMQPDRCARRYHKIEHRASRPPSVNYVGNPPGAIRFSLMKVTRTKPHVACGSSFSRARISSAVGS